MELTSEPDELAAAVLAEEERHIARVRRRRIIIQLAAANYIVRGTGIAPRPLQPAPLDPGSDDATALCGELMHAIADNLDVQVRELHARELEQAPETPAQTARERERREADMVLRRRQLDVEIARRTAAARQLYATVEWLHPRIDPVAVEWWRREGDNLAGRVHATRELDQPPVAYVWFGERQVLLPYDDANRWLAVIADAVAAGAEAERVLVLFQTAREHAMPMEAARLPEYLEHRVAAQLNSGAGAAWDQPVDDYLAKFDPSVARSLHRS